jgi:hypothetical protein
LEHLDPEILKGWHAPPRDADALLQHIEKLFTLIVPDIDQPVPGQIVEDHLNRRHGNNLHAPFSHRKTGLPPLRIFPFQDMTFTHFKVRLQKMI